MISSTSSSTSSAAHGSSRHTAIPAQWVIAGAGLAAILAVVAWLLWLSLPYIATNLAGSQAGVRASYPNYHPSNYHADGLATHTGGTVEIRFRNSHGQHYTIAQTKSGWDSNALLENYVKPTWGSAFETSTAGGLTLYYHQGNATWVSGGILYSLHGNAGLSSSTIRRIAHSL